MLEILKLRLQGLSAYRIARKLEVDPPTVYAGLKAARKNFAAADEMISELKARGWPQKLEEIEKHNSERIQEKKRATQQASRNEEIAIKLG